MDSKTICIARGVAMLSIVAAHVNVPNNSAALRNLLTSGISCFGQHGVIVLFIHFDLYSAWPLWRRWFGRRTGWRKGYH